MPATVPYGAWPSPLAAATVAAAQPGLAWPQAAGPDTYWIESRPAEQGRATLLCRRADGRIEELTPPPANIRTRIQEYGGRPFLAVPGLLVVIAEPDQRVWRLGPEGGAAPLTPESGGRLRYGDLAIDPRRGRLLAVREDHRGGNEPATTIVAIALDAAADAGQVLVGGADFVAAPQLSPDGRRLAWLAWNHPDMPWDAAALHVAELDAAGRPVTPTHIAGGPDEAVVQPGWLGDGTLVFMSDRPGTWQPFAWRAGETRQIATIEGECAGPAWVLGTRWWCDLGSGQIACLATRDGFWRLLLVALDSGRTRALELPFVELGNPSYAGGRLVLQAASTTAPTAIIGVDPHRGSFEVLGSSAASPWPVELVAAPEPLSFTTADGTTAHAFYYAPRNPACRAPAGERPPLIVRSHGGPTGTASPAFRPAWQFWTSRGFALVDVNYRGSTGYGRRYRRALDGAWGVADVEDCIAAARHLVATARADPERLIIAGGSAGGFTTLCALTFHDVFKAGASYYGIGDLEALLHDTHKFESRYLDRLVGPWPAASAIYRARSPRHHIDRLACPVIFFQGLEDKVVPPNQAEAMVEALKAKGLPVAYLAFPGEGHGFRAAPTIIAALEAELAFYRMVFGIIAEEPLPPLDIANL